MCYIYTFLLFFSFHFALTAQKTSNGTKSEYKSDRYFYTYSSCIVNAPAEDVELVLDDIYNGLKNEPTKNLRWAFYGLGRPKNKSKEDNVQLYEKSVTFYPETDVYIVNLMMIIDESDVTEFSIEGELKSVKHPTGKKDLNLNVTKKVKVLNDGHICISSIPQGQNKTVLTLHSKLRFGFIIDLFFTQSKYKEVIEWRLAKFLVNLKDRAEENYMRRSLNP